MSAPDWVDLVNPGRIDLIVPKLGQVGPFQSYSGRVGFIQTQFEPVQIGPIPQLVQTSSLLTDRV